MKNQAHKGRVLVIGAGVSGLTTALCLKEKGFDVTIASEKFAPDITSVVAELFLWEWPPAVCGHHSDKISLHRSKAWSKNSYKIFSQLADNDETGVYMRTVNFYFKHLVENNLRDLTKMNELKDNVHEFTHDHRLIQENQVNNNLGLLDAYAHLAPMIDTDAYMEWLIKEVRKSGCRIISKRIFGNIIEQEEQIKKEFEVEAIVNCAGLGSFELTGDDMYPLRGVLIRISNDGTAFPKITQAHCVSYGDSKNEQDMIFIVPRGENMIVLGGLVEANEWRKDIGFDNYRPIRKMYERCIKFLPMLKVIQMNLFA
jgi:D-amino-acid oxidase